MHKQVRVKIKARDVSLSLQHAQGSSVLKLLPARVLGWLEIEGRAHVLVRLQVGGEQLIARITRYSRDQLGLHRGQALWAQVKSVALLG